MDGFFRKKPIVIRAHYVSNIQKAIAWIQANGGTGEYELDTNKGYVLTLEGVMMFTLGDYLIRGPRDELYPCKGYIFEETYEQVLDYNPTVNYITGEVTSNEKTSPEVQAAFDATWDEDVESMEYLTDR